MDEIASADSAEALYNWLKAALSAEAANMGTHELVWHLSGMPQLYAALSERIVEGPGVEILAASRKKALNLVSGVRASNEMVSMRLDGDEVNVMSPDTLKGHLDKLEADSFAQLSERMDIVFQQFGSRVDQSHKRFLDRALEPCFSTWKAKVKTKSGNTAPMAADALAHQLSGDAAKCVGDLPRDFPKAADDLADTYRSAFGVDVTNFTITPPAAPEIPPPVTLGQTIALDLQTSWWKGWWQRRKGYRAFASGFYDLIEAETTPIVAS